MMEDEKAFWMSQVKGRKEWEEICFGGQGGEGDIGLEKNNWRKYSPWCIEMKLDALRLSRNQNRVKSWKWSEYCRPARVHVRYSRRLATQRCAAK